MFQKHKKNFILALSCIVLMIAAVRENGEACTDFVLNTTGEFSKQVVSARTIDFPLLKIAGLKWVIVPRNYEHKSYSTMLKNSELENTWRSRYGYVAVNFADILHYVLRLTNNDYYLDGMNEKGLSVAMLYLEETAYPFSVFKKKPILVYDLPAYILGNCATVKDVKDELLKLSVHGMVADPLPLHLAVHDAQKNTIIVEWVMVQGERVMRIYEESLVNKVPVMTNDPDYIGQLNNLLNYDNVTNTNAILGAPGDDGYKGRFVRTWINNKFCNMIDSPDGQIAQAFHILGLVDVVDGVNKEMDKSIFRQHLRVYDYTGLPLVRDQTNLVLYWKGYFNQSVRYIDLKKIDFEHRTTVESIPVDVDPGKSKRHLPGQDVTATLDWPVTEWERKSPNDPDHHYALSLGLKVRVNPEDRNKDGYFYIFARKKNGAIAAWDGASWKTFEGNDLPACSEKGKLTDTFFPKLFSRLVVRESDWVGAQIFAGYGKNPSEMLARGTYRFAYQVEYEWQLSND